MAVSNDWTPSVAPVDSTIECTPAATTSTGQTHAHERTPCVEPAEPKQQQVCRSLLTSSLATDVLLASLANALNQADRNIMPIAVIPMAEAFGWSMVQRGLMLSSFAYGYILTQLPGGWVATRLPPLKLLMGAVSCWSLATMLTPVTARLGLGALFACRVAMGVAEGFCLPAIFQLFATRVPEALRSRAFSFMIGCGSAGQLLALLVCPQLSPWTLMFTMCLI